MSASVTPSSLKLSRDSKSSRATSPKRVTSKPSFRSFSRPCRSQNEQSREIRSLRLQLRLRFRLLPGWSWLHSRLGIDADCRFRLSSRRCRLRDRVMAQCKNNDNPRMHTFSKLAKDVTSNPDLLYMHIVSPTCPSQKTQYIRMHVLLLWSVCPWLRERRCKLFGATAGSKDADYATAAWLNAKQRQPKDAHLQQIGE